MKGFIVRARTAMLLGALCIVASVASAQPAAQRPATPAPAVTNIRAIDLDRREHDDEQFGGRGRHHRPGGVRCRIAKWPTIVNQRETARDMDGVLADAGILLTLLAQAERDWTVDVLRIVDQVRQLELDRAPVDHVDDGIHARQRLTFPHATEQRLVGRTRLRRIDADAFVHRADRNRLRRRMFANERLHPGQQRVEPRFPLNDTGRLPPERPGPDDAAQLRCTNERLAPHDR